MGLADTAIFYRINATLKFSWNLKNYPHRPAQAALWPMV
jgi:hypothetical protein